MGKRVKIDFAKHELKTTKYEGILIYELSIPNKNMHKVVFVNTHGIMSVTGDFGNWIFDREFRANEKVEDVYWLEKLRSGSSQKTGEFDEDEILSLIDEFVENFNDTFGREISEEEEEWIQSLRDNANDEIEYRYTAFRCNPITIDLEYVPYSKLRYAQLNCVFDAFDEICERLK